VSKRWLGLIAVGLMLALPLIARKTAGDDGKPVQIEAASPRVVRASILASGNLAFREQSLLSPEVIGRVRAVLVEEGDRVEQGQVVLRLDEQVYQAEVAQHAALVRQQRIHIERQQLNLANQERQWRRVSELHARKLLDDASLENARHALELARVELRASRESLQQAEAGLAQARERLAKTEIRAPLDGTVMALGIKVGETAVSSATGIAGSALMTIANPDSLMTEINVDEADIARIQLGQEVAVYAAAFPDTPLHGEVDSIPLSPKAASAAAAMQSGNTLARNYSVKVRLRDTQGLALRPGMTCRAEIYTSSADEVLAVPVQAVFSNNAAGTETAKNKSAPPEAHHVFVVKDGRAERRIVTLGLSDDSYQEIRTGLVPGDQVVVGPYKVLRHLKAGEALRVEPAKPVTGRTP